ncbi:MAG TPA: TfpX/TfpZ family type IV pilin accessory protein [Steroidobacteraceae bacterium]|nr:TfpX/TfpZ family type IV pilin accessory protein [Steroidobacteraceae bacterium]
MIRWREKFLAFSIHFLVTLGVAACAAALIFFVWFPAPFHEMVGGTKLFLLVVSCDLALGPLSSLVVYSSSKSRGKLIFDYVVIGILQLASFVYGVCAVAEARPVYIVFAKDHLQVVCASEIDEQEIAQVREPKYKSLPKWGPRMVGTKVPREDHNDALFKALTGRDVPLRPRFYVPYKLIAKEVGQRAHSLAEAKAQHSSALNAAAAELGFPMDRLGWLPVLHRTGAWTAIIDRRSGQPLSYINLDPY